jgi:hypothetical protein
VNVERENRRAEELNRRKQRSQRNAEINISVLSVASCSKHLLLKNDSVRPTSEVSNQGATQLETRGTALGERRILK